MILLGKESRSTEHLWNILAPGTREFSGLPKEPYGYLDKSFSFENMIYWENDPTFSYKPEIKA